MRHLPFGIAGDWQTVPRLVPQLQAALAHAKVTGATIVIAKLDRLVRGLDHNS